MATKNPFKADMIRMKSPTGGGSSISVGGFSVDLDDESCAEVPLAHVEQLKAHGFTVAADRVESKPEPKKR